MHRITGLFRTTDTPTNQPQSSQHTPSHSHTSASSKPSTSWWPFNRSNQSSAPSKTTDNASRINKNSRNGPNAIQILPQDEQFETIVFKMPPCDPKLKAEIQIKRIRRFSRFIATGPVDILALSQQTWLGVPNPYRALTWSFLLRYIPTETSSTTPNRKRLISLQRKRSEYAKSVHSSYYTPYHHLSSDYNYPLYRKQLENPDLYSAPGSTTTTTTTTATATTNDAESDKSKPTSEDSLRQGQEQTSRLAAKSNQQGANLTVNPELSPTLQPEAPHTQTSQQSQTQPNPFSPSHKSSANISNTAPFLIDPLSPFTMFPTALAGQPGQPFNIQPFPQPQLQPQLFTPQALSHQISQQDKQLLHQIRIDLPRTLTTYQIIQLPQIQAMLERVLYTWATRHPAASYVQGMNDLCAMIVLIVIEQMMWARVGMSNGFLDVNTFRETILQNLNSPNSTLKSPPPTRQASTSASSMSTNPHDTPHHHTHQINRNGEQFQMFNCDPPTGNFSQAFFDIHLHHHAFSWLFYLSELSSKALERTNSPDDRLLHNYTSNIYAVNSPHDNSISSTSSNLPAQTPIKQPTSTQSSFSVPQSSSSSSSKETQSSTTSMHRSITVPTLNLEDFTTDESNLHPTHRDQPTTLTQPTDPTSTSQLTDQPSSQHPADQSVPQSTQIPIVDYDTISLQDFEDDERFSQLLNQSKRNTPNTTPHDSPKGSPNRSRSASKHRTAEQTSMRGDNFNYIVEEDDLTLLQQDFVEKSKQTQFQLVDTLYDPQRQHVFNTICTFETEGKESQRGVKKLGNLPSLDLSFLVPLYKRVTTTYWVRENNQDIIYDGLSEPKGAESTDASFPSSSSTMDPQHIDNFILGDVDEAESERKLGPQIEVSEQHEQSPTHTPAPSSTPPNNHNPQNSAASSQREGQRDDAPHKQGHPPRANTTLTLPQLGIPTTTITHSISPQTAIKILTHLLDPVTIATIEADVYWLFTLLVDIVQDNFINKQPGIHRMLTKFQNLTQRIDPNLMNWLLEENHLSTIQFAFRWFNCLFVRELPFQYSTRLWDVAFSNLYTKHTQNQLSPQPQHLGIAQQLSGGLNQLQFNNRLDGTSSAQSQPNSFPHQHQYHHHNALLTGSVQQHTSHSGSHPALSTPNPHPHHNSSHNSSHSIQASGHAFHNHNHLGSTPQDDDFQLIPAFQQSSLFPTSTQHSSDFSSRRTDIDIESFENCFVYFGISLLVFFRRIFFAGKNSPNRINNESFSLYFPPTHKTHDDGDESDEQAQQGQSNRGRETVSQPTGLVGFVNNLLNSDDKDGVNVDLDGGCDDDVVIEILDTPSIYHYHQAGIPFHVLTVYNTATSGQNGEAEVGKTKASSKGGGNYVVTNNAITFVNSQHYPSVLYQPQFLLQGMTSGSSIASAIANVDRNKGDKKALKEKRPTMNNAPLSDPQQFDFDTIYTDNLCPTTLHNTQQELLYNNTYRHHTDCVYSHQYEKSTYNLTIALQYIDPVTYNAITTITKSNGDVITNTTPLSAAVQRTDGHQGVGNENDPNALMLSPHGQAILKNAAYQDLNLPQKWNLDNFGDIIIFLQQHIPTITQYLWVNEDLETCLSKMYLLQSQYSYNLSGPQ